MNNALKALVSVNKQSLLRYTQTVNYPVAAGRIVFYMRHSCAIHVQWRRNEFESGGRGTDSARSNVSAWTYKQETVLIITKTLTKTTIVLLEPKMEGRDQKKIFRRFAPDRCPHLQINYCG